MNLRSFIFDLSRYLPVGYSWHNSDFSKQQIYTPSQSACVQDLLYEPTLDRYLGQNLVLQGAQTFDTSNQNGCHQLQRYD